MQAPAIPVRAPEWMATKLSYGRGGATDSSAAAHPRRSRPSGLRERVRCRRASAPAVSSDKSGAAKAVSDEIVGSPRSPDRFVTSDGAARRMAPALL